MPASPPPSSPSDETDLAQTFAEVERSLQELKQRYDQIQAAEHRQQELQPQISQTQRELKRRRSQELQAELRQLQAQLEDVELALESRLLSWSSFKEPFWQAVRFGGIGVVVGWVLHTWAG